MIFSGALAGVQLEQGSLQIMVPRGCLYMALILFARANSKLQRADGKGVSFKLHRQPPCV